MIFRAFWDKLTEITVELDIVYYKGHSRFFKLIDDQNRYYETEIIDIQIVKNCKRYRLKVPQIEIGKTYQVIDERFLRVFLQYRYIVRAEEFDTLYFYDGRDLGPGYSKDKTLFKVWTPVASRVILDIENLGTYEMIRSGRGVYQAEVAGDLDGYSYQYLVNIGGKWQSANDPYAWSSRANNRKSCIIDLSKTEIPLNKDKLPPLKTKANAIIYEIHVRDASIHPSSGISEKGHYLGLTENGTKNSEEDSTGLDYLTELGISHLQFLPFYDFGTVDELNPENYYNWGYDPVQYNIPEGSYASDADDPYCRILELKKMINAIHDRGIRVNMDVVYNHMFDRVTSDFEKLVPYYYFRIGAEGEVSNGSFCGNDLDSTRLMCRKYILDSIERWMIFYGIDGFRFDLMGILDISTMNSIAELVESLDPHAMIYGEGWNMPTLLPENEKANMMNQKMMPDISHFNDFFRDRIKGDTMADNVAVKGLMMGNCQHLNDLPGLLLGSETMFSSPLKSINYVECHDNHTVYDKMTLAGIPEEEIPARVKLMLAVVLFSRGIPFIHAGQEMCRTKKGEHNSYRSSDAINAINWNRRSEHRDLVEYFKDAVKVRNNTQAFRFTDFKNIRDVSIHKSTRMVELDYGDGTRLIINLDNHKHQVDLHGGTVVFNQEGICQALQAPDVIKPLELIVLKQCDS